MADNELITKRDVKALIRNGVTTDTYSDQDCVCELIDDLESVDAIPVGWLNDLINLAETSNIQLYHAIYMVTREWERWKEVQSSLEYCPHCGALLDGGDER